MECNSALLIGITNTPIVKKLPSGTYAANFSLRVPGADGKNTSVPVTVWDPPGWLEGAAEGDTLVVFGYVRRRFYRSASGTTGSQVDVAAEAVARGRDTKRRQALIRKFEEALDDQFN